MEGDDPKKGLSMKFESMKNFDRTDFGDELLLTTTTGKSLTAIKVCKL